MAGEAAAQYQPILDRALEPMPPTTTTTTTTADTHVPVGLPDVARWRSPELEALVRGPLDASGLTEGAAGSPQDRQTMFLKADQLDYKRVLTGC